VAWDSTRPVPWQRLVRDWLIYVSIMAALFLVIYRDELSAGPFVGLAISGPVFVAIGAVLAKFGYQRKTLSDLKRDTQVKRASEAQAAGHAPRNRPAPTRRTSTGPSNRPRSKPKGKRR
jgi:hypothetical protein